MEIQNAPTLDGKICDIITIHIVRGLLPLPTNQNFQRFVILPKIPLSS